MLKTYKIQLVNINYFQTLEVVAHSKARAEELALEDANSVPALRSELDCIQSDGWCLTSTTDDLAYSVHSVKCMGEGDEEWIGEGVNFLHSGPNG